MVSDSQDEEADAYILKDISAPGSTEACYEMVEDDDELQAVYAVFQQMLDDVNFEWRERFLKSENNDDNKNAESRVQVSAGGARRTAARQKNAGSRNKTVSWWQQKPSVRISLSGQQQRKQQPVVL